MACFSWFDPGGCGCGGCSQTFTVNGCNSMPLSGFTVTVLTGPGGSTLASGTTNGSGQVSLSWVGGGSVYVTAFGPMPSRFNGYGSSVTLTCGGSTTITMTPATGYACVAGCAQPAKTTFSVSISATTTTGIHSNASGAATFSGGVWTSVVMNDGSGLQWQVTINQSLVAHVLNGSASQGGVHDCGSTFTGTTVICPPGFSWNASFSTPALVGVAPGTCSATVNWSGTVSISE